MSEQKRRRKSQYCEAATSIAAVALAAMFAQMVEAEPVNNPSVYNDYRHRPSITMPVTMRDFLPSSASGGHADFFKNGAEGAGRYAGIAAATLGGDGSPVMDGTGRKVLGEWRDSGGRSIVSPRAYITPKAGDTAGSMSGTAGGAATSAATFAQWFRDAAGVNTPARREITWNYDAGSAAYVFNGTMDGWKGASDYNYTMVMNEIFVYERGKNWYVDVETSGDAWVYVDDRLVIDGGTAGGATGSGGARGLVVDGYVHMLSSCQVVSSAGAKKATVFTNSAANNTIDLESTVKIDGNVSLGVGANASTAVEIGSSSSISGTVTVLTAPMTMPQLPAIPAMGASVGNYTKTNDTTINADLHCNNFKADASARIKIVGHRTIVCDGKFEMWSSTTLEIQPNSSLTIHCRGFYTESSTQLNCNTKNPALLLLCVHGTGAITAASSSGIYANIIAPDSPMTLRSSTMFYGNVYAQSMDMESSCTFTCVDNSAWTVFAGTASGSSLATSVQRIDLDRLAWLTDGGTHHLRLFYANRTGAASNLRAATNMQLLKVAAFPRRAEVD